VILRPGDEPIPGYRLEKFLGKGQFGQVWKSTSPGKTSAALKFIDLSGNQGWKEFRGIQHVKRIRHAHLMPITAIWMLDSEGGVLNDDVLEGMSGGTSPATETIAVASTATESRPPDCLVVATLLGDKNLLEVLEEHKRQGRPGVPIEELLRYMEEAAKGIDYLNSPTHDLGSGFVSVQHCDIKPANILVVGDSVLICDFGVSRVLGASGSSATATGMPGSPAYMAPECIDRRPSFASDQYSLAVSYIELRTGELPFTDMSFHAVFQAHQTGTLDFSRLSAAEANVLRKATAKNPKDRFANTSEMVRALRRAIEGGSEIDTKKSPRGLKFAARSLAALAIAVAGYLGVRHLTGNDTPETPPQQTTDYTFVVDPPVSELLVDDKPVKLNRSGEVTVQRNADDRVRVAVADSAEFEPFSRTFELRQSADRKFKIELQRKASFHADMAERKLNAGDLDGAAEEYAKAIVRDERTYANVPDPIVLRWPGHGKVRMISAGKTSTFLVAFDNSGSVYAWDLSVPPYAAEPRELFAASEDSIEAIAQGANRVGVIDTSGQIRVRQLNGTVTAIQTFQSSASVEVRVSMSPDGRWLAASGPDKADVQSLEIWDLSQVDGPPIRPPTINESIRDMRFSPDSQWLVWGHQAAGIVSALPIGPSANRRAASASLSGSVEAFECAADSSFIVFAGEGILKETSRTDNSADSGIDPAGEDVHRAAVLNMETGRSWSLGGGHADTMESVAINRTADRIATGGAEPCIQIWNLADGRPHGEPVDVDRCHRSSVKHLFFLERDGWLVSASREDAFLHEPVNPESCFSLGRLDSGVLSLQVSSNEKWIIVLTHDGQIRLWDLPRCQMIHLACRTAGVSPRERLRATPTADEARRRPYSPNRY
jgi:serine/threonine protein kinase/WD40 repeat protein